MRLPAACGRQDVFIQRSWQATAADPWRGLVCIHEPPGNPAQGSHSCLLGSLIAAVDGHVAHAGLAAGGSTRQQHLFESLSCGNTHKHTIRAGRSNSRLVSSCVHCRVACSVSSGRLCGFCNGLWLIQPRCKVSVSNLRKVAAAHSQHAVCRYFLSADDDLVSRTVENYSHRSSLPARRCAVRCLEHSGRHLKTVFVAFFAAGSLLIPALSFRAFTCLLHANAAPGIVRDFGSCAAGSHVVALFLAFVSVPVVAVLAPMGAAFMNTPGSADAPLSTTKSSGASSILLWFTLGTFCATRAGRSAKVR